ncbi:MAG: NAD-dependent epimerase/dehydratase family protein [Terriglobales bacterium]
MRVLIIGGTKFIGPHVVRQFVDQGHDVLLYHRGKTEADLPKNVRHIHSSLAAMPVLCFPHELLAELFDAVVHMIPMGEADSRAAMKAFRGRAARVVALSSGDVYRAYGRLTGTEPGSIEEGLLHEDSPLRSVLYPYRRQAKSAEDWIYDYEKILVEREILGDRDLPGVVLRLPKVYGPGNNADLATVYTFRHRPQWRWTHGYVENVAAAIVLAATHPATLGRIYNVGESPTPTVGDRLVGLPPSSIPTDESGQFNLAQDIAYDTSRIRSELGYAEPVSYVEGLRHTLAWQNQ